MPVTLEHRYVWEDGHDHWLDMRAYPTADGNLAVFWRDITERKRAEERIRESEERHAFLVRFSNAVRELIDPVAVAKTTCRMVLEQMGDDRIGEKSIAQKPWAVL